MFFKIFSVFRSRRKNRIGVMPNHDSLHNRAGVAAAGIIHEFEVRKIARLPHSDETLWEYLGFVLGMLERGSVLDVVSSIRIIGKYAESYDRQTAETCRRWINGAKLFYKTKRDKEVVIYNLTHPTMYDRKRFMEIPISEHDSLKIEEGWSIISIIIGELFFKKDEDISKVPLF